jgi:hypothetical protein
LEWGLPASNQTIRNTIPNAAKKERKKLIGIRPLRFHAFQMGVNCGKRETEVDQSKLLKNTFLVFIFSICAIVIQQEM